MVAASAGPAEGRTPCRSSGALPLWIRSHGVAAEASGYQGCESSEHEVLLIEFERLNSKSVQVRCRYTIYWIMSYNYIYIYQYIITFLNSN